MPGKGDNNVWRSLRIVIIVIVIIIIITTTYRSLHASFPWGRKEHRF
jgi:hypothetical protein